MKRDKGYFITFEGGEGSGKTTQQTLLTEYLRSIGYNVLATRHPGGTQVGEELRRLVKFAPEKTSPRVETLIFDAARVQLVERVIAPFLSQGNRNFVLCDRFADSTSVYQGYVGGLDIDRVRALNEFVVENCTPDLTFLLDIPAEIGLERAGRRPKESESPDRFETESLSFHIKVREGYLKIARLESDRIEVIDANQDANVIHRYLVSRLYEKLNLRLS